MINKLKISNLISKYSITIYFSDTVLTSKITNYIKHPRHTLKNIYINKYMTKLESWHFNYEYEN